MGVQISIVPVSQSDPEPQQTSHSVAMKEEPRKMERTSMTVGPLSPLSQTQNAFHENFSPYSHSHAQLLAFAESLCPIHVQDEATPGKIVSILKRVFLKLHFSQGFEVAKSIVKKALINHRIRNRRIHRATLHKIVKNVFDTMLSNLHEASPASRNSYSCIEKQELMDVILGLCEVIEEDECLLV